jgi:ABC-type sugar transport system, periplasmic component
MKKRKIVAIILVVMLMISMLGGCGKTAKETGSEGAAVDMKNVSAATGRYLEEEVSLPEEGLRLLDIKVLDDGTIGVAVSNDETGLMSLWSTGDSGQTWDKHYDVPSNVEQQEYISSAALSSDKTMVCVSYSMDLSESTLGEVNWQVDESGNRTKVSVSLPEFELSGGPATIGGGISVFGEDEEIINEDIEAVGEGNEIVMMEQGVSIQVGEEANIEDDSEVNSATGILGSEGEIQDGIWSFKASDNKDIIAMTMMNRLFHIDMVTGEVIRAYEVDEESYIAGYSVVNNDIYIETNNGVERYDIATGENKEISAALLAKLASDANNTDGMYMNQGSFVLASKSGEDGALYLADNSGIYRQSEDGTVVEQIVDASLTSLSMPTTALIKLVALADDSFIVHVEGTDGNTLYRYTYSAEAKTTPETEIKIYSLEDNREIRQAIAMYQKANPDVMVSLQVGMTGEDGITIEDALSALNTEIMAGKGPDLLVLDGMPIDSYTEKGILADISDIVDKVDNEDGILAAVKNNYAIASRFTVPYVQGSANYVDMISDVATLETASKASRAEFPDRKSINGMIQEEMMNYLYRIDVNNFITDDGELDKAALQDFLVNAKGIADDNKVEEDLMMESVNFVSLGAVLGHNAIDVAVDLMIKDATIGRGEIKDQNNLATVLALNEKENMVHKLLTDENGKTLILTNTIMGINSKGEQIEKAREFLEFFLSKEVQMSEQELGLPVNKRALTETLNKEFDEMQFGFSAQSEDGFMQEAELTVKPPQEADVRTFEDSILGEVSIGYSNWIVQEIVMEQLTGYIEEQMTLDEAVAGIDRKVSLYLSE